MMTVSSVFGRRINCNHIDNLIDNDWILVL